MGKQGWDAMDIFSEQRSEIFPDKRNLIGLVQQACEGTICLPNFQRDFVWTREEVSDLIRPIVRRWH